MTATGGLSFSSVVRRRRGPLRFAGPSSFVLPHCTIKTPTGTVDADDFEDDVLTLEERNQPQGFGRKGELDRDTILRHLRLLASLNDRGIEPVSIRPWLPAGYSSGVFYHRDVWQQLLVEVFPALRITCKGRGLL